MRQYFNYKKIQIDKFDEQGNCQWLAACQIYFVLD